MISHILADMRFAGAALQTLAAGHMHLGRNEIAFLDAGDFIPEGCHFAAKLMAGNQRGVDPVLRPAVPLINMKIGAADGRNFDLDQDIGPAKRRNLDLADFRSRRGFRLHDREHGFLHVGQPMSSKMTSRTVDFSIAAE